MTNRYKYWLIGLGIVGLVALLSWLWIDYRTTGTTILATHFNRDRAVLINQLRHQDDITPLSSLRLLPLVQPFLGCQFQQLLSYLVSSLVAGPGS